MTKDSTSKTDIYTQSTKRAFKEAEKIGRADVVVGIPFVNEKDNITNVFKAANKGLETYYGDKKAVIVCVGENTGRETLKIINAIPIHDTGNLRRITFLKKGPEIKGKGCSVRAIVQIAQTLKANLVLLQSDLTHSRGMGLRPEWIRLLLEPILREEMDLVIPHFNRHYFDDMLCKNIISPLITGLYGVQITEPLPGVWGISHHLLERYARDLIGLEKDGPTDHGIDIWLVTHAIVYGARMCKVYPGAKLEAAKKEDEKSYILQVIQTMFDQVVADRDWLTNRSSLVRDIDSYGTRGEEEPFSVDTDTLSFIEGFKKGISDFYNIYQKTLPQKIFSYLKILSEKRSAEELSEFDLSLSQWAQTVYLFLFNYSRQELEKIQILESLIPLYLARTATVVNQIKEMRASFSKVMPEVVESYTYLQAENLMNQQINEFIKQGPHLISKWKKAEVSVPTPAKIVFVEGLIPDLALLMPEELVTSDKKRIKVAPISTDLVKTYQKEFEGFVRKTLKSSVEAGFQDTSQAIAEFMSGIEEDLDKTVLPHDLESDEGVVDLVKTIFNIFPHRPVFTFKEEIAKRLLRRYPPTNLLVKVNKERIDDLMRIYEAGHILTITRLTESESYVRGMEGSISVQLSPDDLTLTPLKWLVVNYQDFPELIASKQVCRLDPLTGRVVVTNLSPAMGGKYPKLFYLLSLGQQIIRAEEFGQIWKEFTKEEETFGQYVINSIQGHWGKRLLSGYMVFEAGIHELVARRLRQMSKTIEAWSRNMHDHYLPGFAERLKDLASSYHLAWTFPDGLFVPCSAFSWASYSFMGGKGVPKKIAALVERDCFSRRLLLRCLKEAGMGDDETLKRTIASLIGEGKISTDLTHALFGVPKRLIQEVVTRKAIPTKKVKVPEIAIKEQPTLDDYKEVAPPEQIKRIRECTESLKGKKLQHINSTAVGGGVAEILNRLIPLSNEVGVETGWDVIPGTNEFFTVTKTIHNALQGTKVPWTKSTERIYEETTQDNFKKFMSEGKFYGDIIIVHDPQPAGMIPLIKRKFPDKKIIWRCHIDLARPNRKVWSFIKDYVKYADLAIFHIPEFIPKDLDVPKIVMRPSVDPLSPKNMELPTQFIYSVLDKYRIDKTRPIILQISRFDRFKDPRGVIEAFGLAIESVDAQLVFAGAMAEDDPEGIAILEEIKRDVVAEPDINVLELAATPVIQNHLEVNALQRAAAVVLQKSLREGFGLTATEAMWKGKPVVAGNIGGLKYQIMDGVTGYLVGDVDKNGYLVYSKEQSAGRIKSLLAHPKDSERMGRDAKEYVRKNFLITRHLGDYLELARWLFFGTPLSF